MTLGLGLGLPRGSGAAAGSPAFVANLVNGALPQGTTYSRTSTALYYNQSGLLSSNENLLTYSSSVGGTQWSQNNVTPTLNSVVAPDGTMTGSTFVETTATGVHDSYSLSQPGSVVGQAYVYSCYLKAGIRTIGMLRVYQAVAGLAANSAAYFNLSTGVVASADAGLTASISAVGNGWYRCSIRFVCTYACTLACSNGMTTAAGTYSYTGDGVSNIYIWGAQLQNGTQVSQYNPTTTAAVYGSRFDCNPNPANATQYNSVYLSNTIPTAGFNSTGIVKTYAAAPDGSNTGALIVGDTSGTHQLYANSPTFLTTAQYTISVYAKAAGQQFVVLGEANSGTYLAAFDLINGTTTGTNYNCTSLIQSIGNGWYRCIATVASITGNPALRPTFFGYPTGATYTAYSATYTGDNISGVVIAWPQVNYGSVALPYLANTSSIAPARVSPITGLLIEQASTNLVTYSNTFTNAIWGAVAGNVTVTTSGASPDGTADAQLLTATTTAATTVSQGIATTATATSYTYSIYAKASTGNTIGNRFILRNVTTATNVGNISIDYSTGVITVTTGTATAQNVGNGWWRIVLTVTSGITVGDALSVYAAFAGGAANAGDAVYVYGAQLEALAFPTSYIPVSYTHLTLPTKA